MNRILFASALAAVLAAAPLVAFAGPNDKDSGPGRKGRGSMGERGPGRRALRHERRGLRALKALELTDSQKALLADGRAASEPVRQDLRTKIRAVFDADAKPTTPTDGQSPVAERVARREQIRALIAAARTQVEPSARTFVASLSVEQKAKLAERALKHDRTFDEAKFTQRVAGLFLAPKHRRHHGEK